MATPTRNRWKPGASRRERNEHSKWVTRPHGLRARETRSTDRKAWKVDQRSAGA